MNEYLGSWKGNLAVPCFPYSGWRPQWRLPKDISSPDWTLPALSFCPHRGDAPARWSSLWKFPITPHWKIPAWRWISAHIINTVIIWVMSNSVDYCSGSYGAVIYSLRTLNPGDFSLSTGGSQMRNIKFRYVFSITNSSWKEYKVVKRTENNFKNEFCKATQTVQLSWANGQELLAEVPVEAGQGNLGPLLYLGP